MEHETLWERMKQGLLESATIAAQKAEHLGKVGRARLDIAETRHAIRDAFAELGGAVYTHLQKDANAAVGKKQDVQTVIDRIAELEGVLQEREARLQAIKSAGGEDGEDGGKGAEGGGKKAAETDA